MIIRHILKKRSGVTLVEIVILMSVLILIASAIGSMGTWITRLRTAVMGSTLSQESVNRVMTPLVSELRSMQLSNTGIFPIEVASTSSLTFYSDVNKDGLVERIRYFLEDNILKRGVVVPVGNPLVYNLAGEIVNNVLTNVRPNAGDVFAYYGDAVDIDGVPLSIPPTVSSVRVVKITLVVDQNPGQSPGPLNYTTSVTPRNLRNN